MAKRRMFVSGPAEIIKEPMLYRLVKDFDIMPSVRRADVQAKEAWLVLELEADEEESINRGVEYLKSLGASIRALEGDMVES
ncbi:MAG: NIL domain-containing protein [bacterium]